MSSCNYTAICTCGCLSFITCRGRPFEIEIYFHRIAILGWVAGIVGAAHLCSLWEISSTTMLTL